MGTPALIETNETRPVVWEGSGGNAPPIPIIDLPPAAGSYEIKACLENDMKLRPAPNVIFMENGTFDDECDCRKRILFLAC